MGSFASWLEKKLAIRLNKVLEFYEGEVVLLQQSLKYSTYRIIENNAAIDVHVAAHVRKVEHQFSLPPTFEILAPMKYVKLISGTIPEHHIRKMMVREYSAVRSMFNTR